MTYGKTRHEPVLAKEIIEMTGVRGDGIYCDATAGGGGFSQQIIDRLDTGRLIAFDRDRNAVEALRELWRGDRRVEVVHANFEHLKAEWTRGGWPAPDAVIYDLGLSSIQLEDPSRGLSFQLDSPLDMRLDPDEQTPTAAEIVNSADEAELADMFFLHGENGARRIARRIVREREAGSIETTLRLAQIVTAALGAKKKARGTRQQKSSLH